MILVIKRNLEDLYLYRECTVKTLHVQIEIMTPGGRVFPYFGYTGTFWFTLSQYDFVVFAFEPSLIVPQVSLSKSVRRFVNHCANNLKEGLMTIAIVD